MNSKRESIVMPRRELLRGAVKGAAGLMAAATLSGAARDALAAYSLTPSTTEGPYCLDLGLQRSDIRSSTIGNLEVCAGMPLLLTLNVCTLNADGSLSPVKGAIVDIWHCNAQGYYSGETNSGMANKLSVNWLRGYQVSNARGAVRFISVYPGWYTGRCVHIHIRTRLFSGTTATYDQTTQLFFDDALTAEIRLLAPYTTDTQKLIYNGSDNIYGGASGNIARATRTNGYISASMNVVINPAGGVRTLNCPASVSG